MLLKYFNSSVLSEWAKVDLTSFYLLLTKKEKDTVFALRKAMNSMPVADVTEEVINQMTLSKNNEEFVDKMDNYLRRFK